MDAVIPGMTASKSILRSKIINNTIIIDACIMSIIILILLFIDLYSLFCRVIIPRRSIVSTDAGHYRWLIQPGDAAAVIGGGNDGADAPLISTASNLHHHTGNILASSWAYG